MSIETGILKAIYSLVGTSSIVDGLLIFCASWLVYIITFVFLWLLLAHREPYERLVKIFYSSLALVISAGVFHSILNYAITRAAPSAALKITPLVSGFGGFPAFITTWAVTVACVSYIAISRRLGFWLFIISGIIAFAQMYVGISWPSDVLAGGLIGLAGALIAQQLIPPTRS